MAKLPEMNPIDAGYVQVGAPVDHLGAAKIFCSACGSDQNVERYRLIIGGQYFGFGAPQYIRPFLKKSSTRGKLGKRGTYALCCKCGSLWSQDQGARDSLEKLGANPDGIIPEHMEYEVLNRAFEESEKPTTVGLTPKSKVRKLVDDTQQSQQEPSQPASRRSSRVNKLEPEPTPHRSNPDVDEDPKVRELREQLAEAEAEAAQRIAKAAERNQATRRIEELEQTIIEKTQIIEQVLEEIEKHKADLAELKKQDTNEELEPLTFAEQERRAQLEIARTSVSANELGLLSLSDDPEIRFLVTQNLHVGTAAIRKLMSDPDDEVRHAAERANSSYAKRERERIELLASERAPTPRKESPKHQSDWSDALKKASQSNRENEKNVPIASNEAENKNDAVVECGACGTLVMADSNFCPSCKTNFDDEGYDCSYCGAETSIDASFCPSCGEAFQQRN